LPGRCFTPHLRLDSYRHNPSSACLLEGRSTRCREPSALVTRRWSPRAGLTLWPSWSRRRHVDASSFLPAVPPACHKQRSPAVSSGQSRSLREGRHGGYLPLTSGVGAGRNCMACKGSCRRSADQTCRILLAGNLPVAWRCRASTISPSDRSEHLGDRDCRYAPRTGQTRTSTASASMPESQLGQVIFHAVRALRQPIEPGIQPG
jgi:hypothetical protein